jgi:hypothetical protein
MKRSWKQWLVIACVATVAVPALAQSKNDELVVNGKDWMSASVAERKAFLVGVANMIMAEGAYAKRNNQATPPVSAGIINATQTAKIGDIEARITRWYEANSAKLATPVMAVVWQDIVKGPR